MLRNFAIAVALVLAGGLATLMVVVAVFDFNRLKLLITARVATISGRQPGIGGDLNVRKSVTPAGELEPRGRSERRSSWAA